MRNISQVAATLVLLATQVNVPLHADVADAATASATATSNYEVSLQTNTPEAVVVTGPNQPDYDSAVLNPLHAAQAAKAAAAKAKRRVVASVAPKLVPGSHTDWMAAAGIAPSDYGYVDYIISRESGWGVTKWNRAGSGAYGLGQALPATKMAPFGSDYMTNPVTQLKWASTYAKSRYGSWAAAYTHWVRYHSW